MPTSDEDSRGPGAPMEVDDGTDRTTIAVADTSSGQKVSPHVLGKFTEMNGREGYPGILSEHLANGSFEEWYTWPKRTPSGDPAWWRRSEVLFRDVDPYPGVAYPWAPVQTESTRATFENPVGGAPVCETTRESSSGASVHGRVSGQDRADVHDRPYREPEPRYQRITVWEGRAGIEQRLALPDERTLGYELTVSIRGHGLDGTCTVQCHDPSGTQLADVTLPFDDDWSREQVTLDLAEESSTRYRESAFGEVTLSFVVEGRGHVDVDWARLRADDAVRGLFNPTTVEHVRSYDIPCIRWPGGNFVSQYHWRDGVGPVGTRPVRSELHWGGLEPNYLGVNEFLEFCAVTGVEPYLNVGFSEEITPEEAAAMVEYVNGDPDETEYGALRAEHGHEAPWGVETWQVGNEVWGSFQIGHTDAADYADRYVEYYDQMTAVDPDITVFAVGLDPGDEPRGGNGWNKILFDVAGDRIDGIDIHRYVHGESGDREWEPVAFNQQLVLYPTQFDRKLGEVIDASEEAGIDDLDITVGEWNMGAGGLETGRRAVYGTMAHAAFCAGMYNAFLRRGETVRFGHQRDNAFKHRPYPADLRPMYTANNAVLRRYTAVLTGDQAYELVPTVVEGPTGHIDRHGETITAMDDIPYIDVAAVRSVAKGERSSGDDGDDDAAHDDESTLHLFVTNRDLTTSRSATIELPSTVGRSATVTSLWADDPLDDEATWSGETSYQVTDDTIEPDDGSVTLEIPPAGFCRLDVPVDGDRT